MRLRSLVLPIAALASSGALISMIHQDAETVWGKGPLSSPGRQILSASLIGAASGLADMGKISDSNLANIALIGAELPADVRTVLMPVETNAREQALRGEWSDEALSGYIKSLSVNYSDIPDVIVAHFHDTSRLSDFDKTGRIHGIMEEIGKYGVMGLIEVDAVDRSVYTQNISGPGHDVILQVLVQDMEGGYHGPSSEIEYADDMEFYRIYGEALGDDLLYTAASMTDMQP